MRAATSPRVLAGRGEPTLDELVTVAGAAEIVFGHRFHREDSGLMLAPTFLRRKGEPLDNDRARASVLVMPAAAHFRSTGDRLQQSEDALGTGSDCRVGNSRFATGAFRSLVSFLKRGRPRRAGGELSRSRKDAELLDSDGKASRSHWQSRGPKSSFSRHNEY
ncbi:MAG: hypothetical protein JWL84_2789 [Rhodospirillales bacterium]|nr:hypothetical protein [Rhodospirillales bacterium]